MPSPATTRGLLGHFLGGKDPPVADQNISPPPVQSPTYLSLRAVLAAGAGGGGPRGGAGGHRIQQDGICGYRGAGVRYRDGHGTMRGTEGAEKETTEETAGTAN